MQLLFYFTNGIKWSKIKNTIAVYFSEQFDLIK